MPSRMAKRSWALPAASILLRAARGCGSLLSEVVSAAALRRQLAAEARRMWACFFVRTVRVRECVSRHDAASFAGERVLAVLVCRHTLVFPSRLSEAPTRSV